MSRKPYGVLIVHGFTASMDCVSGLEPPIQALGLPTRVPVLRGHCSESPAALCGVTWHDWAADAEAALEDLLTEAERAIVFGHSMGGLVALTLAADRPDVVDSLIVAAAAIQLTSPFAPGHPLHFLAPLVMRLQKKVDVPPVYADPALAQDDTNYAWAPSDAVASLMEFAKATRRRLPEVRVPTLIMHSRKDTTVDPKSAEIIYRHISTPPDQKRIVWFEVTEHEMFRDCERDATITTVVDYVRERAGLTAGAGMPVDEALTALRIDGERFRADFQALAKIGATGDGGVHRPALSEAHLEARAWFRERVTAAGLQFHTDGAGNHSAVLACGPTGAPTLLLGSHLDSVPYGGRFDGPLGVLAALEALRVVQEAGVSLPVHLEAIDFTDEEGTLFGELGSTALAGTLTAEVLRESRGGRATLEAGLARAGLTEAGLLTACRDPASLAGYLELHIEQGPRMVDAQVDIGVVTGIVGMGSYRLAFVGRADHAGTTSMVDRRDAGLGASAFALAAREVVMDDFPDCVANVGDMRFAPGAFNIIPAQVALALEFRAPEPALFRRLEEVLLERARAEAQRFGLGLEVERLGWLDPAPMSEVAQRAFAEAAHALGLRHIALFSGAGHDAQSLAGLCPVGMIFVPSVGGASHSPREFTRWADCLNGANVLLQAALRMAIDGERP